MFLWDEGLGFGFVVRARSSRELGAARTAGEQESITGRGRPRAQSGGRSPGRGTVPGPDGGQVGLTEVGRKQEELT